MKKINLVICFLIIYLSSWAQRFEPVNPQDKQEYEGYTIKLVPAMAGTYGYAILKGKSLVVFQNRNPFTSAPLSLSKKEDAYKVAQWQIQQLRSQIGMGIGRPLAQGKDLKLPPALEQKLQLQGSRGPWVNQRFSPKVADELKITINH